MKFTTFSWAALLALAYTNAFAAENIADAFKEAQVSGKIRFNYFNWQWNDLDDYNKGNAANNGGKINPDSEIAALGGSVAIKTSTFNHFRLQGEYFTSQPISALSHNAIFAKSGADLDRGNAFNTSASTYTTYAAANGVVQTPDKELDPINVLGIANIQFEYDKSIVTAGRQYFETPLTGADDTKMIPYTFNGYTAINKDIPDTTLTLGYITDFKLRNETSFGGLLDNDSYTNKGLRTSGLTTGGTAAFNNLKKVAPDYLGVIGVDNSSFANLKLQLWYYQLDGILSDVIAEANYKININDFSITLGGRYLRQIDQLDGKLGSANIAAFDGSNTGYKTPTSLNSTFWAYRAIAEKGATKFQLAYSAVSNDADILSPWGSYPTKGYTATMKIENYDANIRSYSATVWYDFEKAGLINGLSTNLCYLFDNRDESKIQPKGDMRTITADVNYKFTNALSGRIRFGDHNDKGNAQYAKLGTPKGWDFTEYRAELIYKF